MTDPLLQVADLTVSYASGRGRSRSRRTVLHGVSFDIQPGEVLALVGESGSGKTTIGQSLIGLLPSGGRIDGGSIELRLSGRPIDLTRLAARAARETRGRRIGLVPQDPGVSLNPVRTIGAAVAAPLLLHRATDARWRDAGAVKARVLDLLDRVGLDAPDRRAKQYPHELSGGMRQRVLIAAAIALEPALVVADEPTSALDVTVQRRILDLLGELRTELSSSLLLITHDLALAAERADRLAVLRGGRLEEVGNARDVLHAPQSSYTRALLTNAPALQSSDPRPERPLADPFVQVISLRHEYGKGAGAFRAVDDVSFTIERGTTRALVGESGSGKTTIGRAVAAFTEPTAGAIWIGDRRLDGAPRDRSVRRIVQLVSQNPFASLDPRRTIAQSVGEPLLNWRARDGGVRELGRRARAALDERVADALEQVSLDAALGSRLPRELSGGQRQRVAIARALILQPELVVLDEAVSALDVTVQSQILDLLDRLQREHGLTYLFITHNLAVVRRIADSVTVLRRGEAVESGSAESVLTAPAHPYTSALLEAVPSPQIPTIYREVA